MASFSAQVLTFTDDAKENAGMIFAGAVNKLERGIKTNIRKDTANMMRSVILSTTSMPQVDTELKEYPETSFTVLPSHIGKPVYLAVQAAYAPRWEFGFVGTDSLGRTYNQAGDFTFQKEGAKWAQYVAEAEAEFAK
jgi:hypothetical protein